MEPLDHKNLDKDVPYFSEVVRWVMEGLEQSPDPTWEAAAFTCVLSTPVHPRHISMARQDPSAPPHFAHN